MQLFYVVEIDTTLNQIRCQSVGLEFIPAPGAGKEASLILQELGFYDKSALPVGFGEPHASQTTFNSGIGIINLPPRCR
jgi:hypothetical protein